MERSQILLRCTAKLLKLLEVRPASLVEPRSVAKEREWYGNLLWIDRRKCLLFTHAETLFSFLVPNVLKREILPLGPFFMARLQSELDSEGLPRETFNRLDSTELRLAKTTDRSVLGCMNDLAFQCEYSIVASGGLAHCDVRDLNHRLRRTIHSPTGYALPIERAGALSRSPLRD